jgi:hypothetical protein
MTVIIRRSSRQIERKRTSSRPMDSLKPPDYWKEIKRPYKYPVDSYREPKDISTIHWIITQETKRPSKYSPDTCKGG